MRYFNGLRTFRGKDYTTQRATLQAAWIRQQTGGQKSTALVLAHQSGKDSKATQTY